MASVLLGARFQGAPLAGTCEHVEGSFGEAVACRDETVTLCARDGGLGPPDLVWLRKARARHFGLGIPQRQVQPALTPLRAPGSSQRPRRP